MDVPTATALRRGGLAVCGALATLVAHSAASGHLAASLLTPFVLLSVGGVVVASALLRGARPGDRFAVWGPIRTFALLTVVQFVAHAGLWLAPWMYGLGDHHRATLLQPVVLGCHVLVAALFTWVLGFGQGFLARLVAVLSALLRPRAARHPDSARMERPVQGRPARPILGSRLSRGPPVTAIAPSAIGAARV